jgi:hypothetical protein
MLLKEIHTDIFVIVFFGRNKIGTDRTFVLFCRSSVNFTVKPSDFSTDHLALLPSVTFAPERCSRMEPLARIDLHCRENPIYVLPEKKVRGPSPSFPIHVSVSDLFISTIGPPIFLRHNRQTDLWEYKKLLTET